MASSNKIRLGINIDHIATIRNARGSKYPDLMRACEIVAKNAELITIHLREDRRHINDADVFYICANRPCPVNLEVGLDDEIASIAIKARPDFVCIVPEKREEVTTESGLDISRQNVFDKLQKIIPRFKEAKIKVSLFLDPNPDFIDIIKSLEIDAVEIHTGKYANLCDANLQNDAINELEKISLYAKELYKIGISVHAGHGLTYENVSKITQIKEISELNIGHFLITEAIFTGLENAISKMKELILN